MRRYRNAKIFDNAQVKWGFGLFVVLCVTARRNNEAIQSCNLYSGLLRFARNDAMRVKWIYSCGPAATKALPASLVVNFSKFLMKREERSLALSSQTLLSA